VAGGSGGSKGWMGPPAPRSPGAAAKAADAAKARKARLEAASAAAANSNGALYCDESAGSLLRLAEAASARASAAQDDAAVLQAARELHAILMTLQRCHRPSYEELRNDLVAIANGTWFVCQAWWLMVGAGHNGMCRWGVQRSWQAQTGMRKSAEVGRCKMVYSAVML
jgi:hypothetical protein